MNTLERMLMRRAGKWIECFAFGDFECGKLVFYTVNGVTYQARVGYEYLTSAAKAPSKTHT